MAEKKVKVKVDVETNAEASIAQLKELKKQLRETAAGSTEFKKIAAQIRDVEDAIEESRTGAEDWAGSLEKASGPLGLLGKGIRQAEITFSSFNTALKASVIGIVVAAIGGLVAAFQKSEEAQKKLQPIFIAFEKILGGIFRALEPLIDGFIELATQALPYVTKGVGIFYSALVGLFTYIKEAGTGVAKVWKAIFTLDTDLALEGINQIKNSFATAADAGTEAYKRFEVGTKELTKTEKEENEKRQKDADEAAAKRKAAADKAAKEKEEKNKKEEEDRKKAFDDNLKAIETQNKLDEAQLKKQKELALAAAQTEQEKLDVEKQFAAAANKQRLSDLDEKLALYKADSDEYKNLQVDKINLEADYISQLSGFAEKQKKINEDAAKDKKEKELKAAEDSRGILLTGLQSQFEALDAANKQSELDFAQDLERLAQQKEILAQQEATELQNTELTEFQKTEVRKKYADARKGITDQEIATEKAAMEAKHEINMAYLGLFEQFGNVLQQVAGKNKALAIAGVVISQAASIGQIIANTGIANAKALAASPLTFGQPWIAINTISAALSIASTIAGAVKSIQQINQAASQAGVKGGGGGSAATTAPNIPVPRVAGAAAPQIQTTGGTNPNTQIAETIAGARAPLKAYVISGEVSSQQALDRRTSRAATFTGG